MAKHSLRIATQATTTPHKPGIVMWNKCQLSAARTAYTAYLTTDRNPPVPARSKPAASFCAAVARFSFCWESLIAWPKRKIFIAPPGAQEARLFDAWAEYHTFR